MPSASNSWFERIRDPNFRPPIGTLLDISLVSIEPGVCVMEMTPKPTQWNPLGTLHGGILCDLGDAAMGTAMLTTLNDDESVTTIELKAAVWSQSDQVLAWY